MRTMMHRNHKAEHESGMSVSLPFENGTMTNYFIPSEIGAKRSQHCQCLEYVVVGMLFVSVAGGSTATKPCLANK